MSLTKLLVPTYKQMLQALAGWLEKAKAEAADPEALLSARLAPDMLPLSSQVRFACLQAQEPFYRLNGEPLPEALNTLAKEGQNGGAEPGCIGAAQDRIAKALSALNGLNDGALDLGAERDVAIELPDGMTFDMTGEQYARDWALPQFYFHVVTAYAILRAQSIELGKANYVQHMFGYIRAGTGPCA